MMNNPFNMMGNPMQMIMQRFNQFRQTFQGDPQQQVQQMLNSGRIQHRLEILWQAGRYAGRYGPQGWKIKKGRCEIAAAFLLLIRSRYGRP